MSIPRVQVIVLGGGPAGLLAAAHLAPSLEVMLLERGQIGTTDKFWLSTIERLKLHGLEDCIVHRANRGTVGCFLGPPAVASGEYCVVDEEHLLRTLKNRCASRGVRLREGVAAMSVSWGPNELSVRTTSAEARCRLIVDATGGNSPLALTFRLQKIKGFYSIFGAHLQGVDLLTQDIVGAEVLRLGLPLPLFEMVPTGGESAHVVLFHAVQRLIPPSNLEVSFNEHLCENPFFRMRSSTVATPTLGAIPIGAPSARRLPGVIAVGEAGMIQAPLLGTAFNEVLDTIDPMMNRVLAAFDSQKHGVVSPRVSVSGRKRANDAIQSVLASLLLRGSIEGFERLVRFLHLLGPERAYRLFASRLHGMDWQSIICSAVRARLGRDKLAPQELSHNLPRNQKTDDIGRRCRDRG